MTKTNATKPTCLFMSGCSLLYLYMVETTPALMSIFRIALLALSVMYIFVPSITNPVGDEKRARVSCPSTSPPTLDPAYVETTPVEDILRMQLFPASATYTYLSDGL